MLNPSGWDIMDSVLIFVRQKQSLKFLTNDGGWAMSFSEARTFQNTWAALDTCMKQGVHRAEIVMRFGSPSYDVLLDIA
jgi:hypothetical protein